MLMCEYTLEPYCFHPFMQSNAFLPCYYLSSCRSFVERECDTFWMDVDGLVGNWSDKGERTDPAPGGLSGNYVTQFKVQYCKIDGTGCTSAASGGRRQLGDILASPDWITTNNCTH